MEPPHVPAPFDPSVAEPAPGMPGFPLDRDSLTLTELFSHASDTWSRDLGAWVLAMLLYGVLGVGVPFVLGGVWGFYGALQGSSGADPGTAFTLIDLLVRGALQVIQLVISAVFTLGLWAMAVVGLHRRPTTVGVLFSQLSKVWKYIVQAMAVVAGTLLLVGPVVLVVFLAFIGPVDRSTPMEEIMERAGQPLLVSVGVLLPLYVYLVAGLAFMHAELAYNDDAGPIEAIVTSWRIARGRRWRIIGVGLIAGLIWVGSAMLCGIGLLFGGPLTILLMGALYLGLRQGADVPSARTDTTLGRAI